MEPTTIAVLVIIGVPAVLFILMLLFTYRIVPKSQAHVVVTPSKTMICSGNPAFSRIDGKPSKKATYFHFPEWIPFLGRTLRVMDITTKEVVIDQETIEKGQARYSVKSSTKYRVKDVDVASETTTSDTELKKQLEEVIRAGIRAITVKYDVVEARANKQDMETGIRQEIEDDFAKWGLELVNFQLVDFSDTNASQIISNISKRREVEIEAQTRQENAERIKAARMKEAESDEKAKEREIKRDEIVGMREENKKQKIAEQAKLAKEKHFEVVRVETIKQAEITKDEAIVQANQAKDQEKILMEQKRLEGQGDKLRDMEKAKGEAAPILEKGLAEAKAKDALQEALNKFGDEAIRALVAEKIVEMQKEVGIAGAKALEVADVRMFSGSDGGGFDIGKMVASMMTSNDAAAASALNKLARPNDLGFGNLDLDKFKKIPDKPSGKKDPEPEPEKPKARPRTRG